MRKTISLPAKYMHDFAFKKLAPNYAKFSASPRNLQLGRENLSKFLNDAKRGDDKQKDNMTMVLLAHAELLNIDDKFYLWMKLLFMGEFKEGKSLFELWGQNDIFGPAMRKIKSALDDSVKYLAKNIPVYLVKNKTLFGNGISIEWKNFVNVLLNALYDESETLKNSPQGTVSLRGFLKALKKALSKCQKKDADAKIVFRQRISGLGPRGDMARRAEFLKVLLALAGADRTNDMMALLDKLIRDEKRLTRYNSPKFLDGARLREGFKNYVNDAAQFIKSNKIDLDDVLTRLATVVSSLAALGFRHGPNQKGEDQLNEVGKLSRLVSGFPELRQAWESGDRRKSRNDKRDFNAVVSENKAFQAAIGNLGRWYKEAFTKQLNGDYKKQQMRGYIGLLVREFLVIANYNDLSLLNDSDNKFFSDWEAFAKKTEALKVLVDLERKWVGEEKKLLDKIKSHDKTSTSRDSLVELYQAYLKAMGLVLTKLPERKRRYLESHYAILDNIRTSFLNVNKAIIENDSGLETRLKVAKISSLELANSLKAVNTWYCKTFLNKSFDKVLKKDEWWVVGSLISITMLNRVLMPSDGDETGNVVDNRLNPESRAFKRKYPDFAAQLKAKSRSKPVFLTGNKLIRSEEEKLKRSQYWFFRLVDNSFRLRLKGQQDTDVLNMGLRYLFKVLDPKRLAFPETVRLWNKAVYKRNPNYLDDVPQLVKKVEGFMKESESDVAKRFNRYLIPDIERAVSNTKLRIDKQREKLSTEFEKIQKQDKKTPLTTKQLKVIKNMEIVKQLLQSLSVIVWEKW